MIFINNYNGGMDYLFTAFVNGITEKKLPNGGVITNYRLGTSELKNKGTENERKEYSTWFATLMGEARKKAEANPLKEGDRILVDAFKISNVSRKNADGSYAPAFFSMSISNYHTPDGQAAVAPVDEEDSLPF